MSDIQTPVVPADEAVNTTPAEIKPEELSMTDYRAYRKDPEAFRKAKSEATSVAPATDEEVEAKPAEAPEAEDDIDADEEAEEAKPSKKGGFQRRIDKLTRERADRDAQIADLQRQLAGNSAAKPNEPGEKAQPKPSQAQDASKPKLESFNTYDEYVEALSDWKLDQRDKLRENQAAQKRVLDSWNAKQEESRKVHEDFDDTLAATSLPPAHVQRVILESDNSAEVAYFLAKNPAELRKLSTLSPMAAAREIGKIESKLESAAAKPEPGAKPKVTAAPAPIKPVGPKASTSTKKPEEMSMSEYRDWRNKSKRR